MRNSGEPKDQIFKTIDDFLIKSFNVILASRVQPTHDKTKPNNSKVMFRSQQFFMHEAMRFDLAEHFNDEYEELKASETKKYYILDIFLVKDNVKLLVEKFIMRVEKM